MSTSSCNLLKRVTNLLAEGEAVCASDSRSRSASRRAHRSPFCVGTRGEWSDIRRSLETQTTAYPPHRPDCFRDYEDYFYRGWHDGYKSSKTEYKVPKRGMRESILAYLTGYNMAQGEREDV